MQRAVHWVEPETESVSEAATTSGQSISGVYAYLSLSHTHTYSVCVCVV